MTATHLDDLLAAADLTDRADRLMLADALEDAGREEDAMLCRSADRLRENGGKLEKVMTALEFANANENVVLRYASQGAPAGQDVPLLPETDLPFSLDEVEGVLDADGDFVAINLFDADAQLYRFTDWRTNNVYALWLRIDAAIWQEAYEESMEG